MELLLLRFFGDSSANAQIRSRITNFRKRLTFVKTYFSIRNKIDKQKGFAFLEKCKLVVSSFSRSFFFL